MRLKYLRMIRLVVLAVFFLVMSDTPILADTSTNLACLEVAPPAPVPEWIAKG